MKRSGGNKTLLAKHVSGIFDGFVLLVVCLNDSKQALWGFEVIANDYFP
ncbi:hypothetical protein [Bacteroides timonensis]|nr:hypothetical protein [Bacteroides timonensis]